MTVTIVASLLLALAPSDADAAGPEKGTLIIMGGGGGKGSTAIYRRFAGVAGGRQAKIVVVTTAGSSSPNYDYTRSGFARYLKSTVGVAEVTVLHTHDRKKSDTEDFVRPITEATGVWFSGGRQWRLVDAYAGTRTEKEFHQVLARGGVIGGSSAGATIQGSFLVRGDTKTNTIMIGDHQKGFGFLKNSAIDQHVVARGRQLDLIEVLADPKGRMLKEIDRTALLGIGIDENTAIEVTGNRFEVLGKEGGEVLIYDPRTWKDDTPDREKYVTLKTGTKYDLKRRKVVPEK